MIDAIHRILTGSTISPFQLRVAGVVVATWIGMDVIQFIDWLANKISPVIITVHCQ